MLTIDAKLGPKLKKREWDPDAGGYGVRKITGVAIVLPVAGVALLLDGHLWSGVFTLLLALALIITAYFWWTRPRH